jgi:hypothetical protein
MNELDRIEHALAHNRLDASLFERCATDLLSEVYPGISPIPGGTDWGRDADIYTGLGEEAPRLLVTMSRSIAGVRKNISSGLRSMRDHNVPVQQIVLANPMPLGEQEREKLRVTARNKNVTIQAFYGQQFFASKLRRDTEWRKALLGLSGHALTLSRLPVDLAESPWVDLPLTGRDDDLNHLESVSSDVVLYGNPGVGKTRLAAAVGDIVFVDGDAASDRLLDDLRRTTPNLVALDDAGQHVELLRRLIHLRRIERDLLAYRIVAVCWPDEVAKIKDALTSAAEIEVGLLERSAVDSIVVSMGVTSHIARNEILGQAEGRPGWAIALADILTKTQTWNSLFDGKALLGQVEGHLRRSQIEPSAINVLTVVSALGGVRASECGKLAVSLHMSLPEITRLLQSAAHSGLVDTSHTFDSQGMPDRTYQVRPPMLADALVAEHTFRSKVAAVRVVDLLQDWPEKLQAVTESSIDSALLGVDEATPVAGSLIRRYRDSDTGSPHQLQYLAKRYACIDQRTGEEVLAWLRQDFDMHRSRSDLRPGDIEPLNDLAALLARRYLLSEAVEMLLNAALLDARPQNRSPGHPLRKLADLLTGYHPELSPPPELRHVVATALDAWIARRMHDVPAWHVYQAAIPIVMSIHRHASYLSPGDPRQMHISESIVSPTEIQGIYETIWPSTITRLKSAPLEATKAAIDLVSDWLRVGAGYDRPFGRDHDTASIKAAARYARRQLNDLKPLVERNLGLSMLLRRNAQWHDVSLRMDMDKTYEVFFTDVERGTDWQTSTEELRNTIRTFSRPWATEEPALVVARLSEIKGLLELAEIKWPPRIGWACTAIAEALEDLTPWVEAALEADLFPDAAPFVSTAFEQGKAVPLSLLERCIGSQAARWSTLSSILSSDASPQTVQLAIQSLAASDEGILEALAFQDRLAPDRLRRLLSEASDEVRGATAFALFRAASDKNKWPPSDLGQEWFDAIKLFSPAVTSGHQSHYLRTLFEFLAATNAAVLTEYVEARLEIAVVAGTLSSLTELKECLYTLPADAKTAIMQRFGSTDLRWFLLDYIAGKDIQWIAGALDQGLITPTEALETRDGFGPPEPSIVELAQLLVPRGIDPSTIASLARYGVDFGEESDRFAKLIAEFSEYAKSEEPNIAKVGRAGVAMYGEARERAISKERIARIRGEL